MFAVYLVSRGALIGTLGTRFPRCSGSYQRPPSAILTVPARRPLPATAPPPELAVPHSELAISPSTWVFHPVLSVNMY